MPPLNTPLRQPIAALIYTSFGSLFAVALLVLLALALSTSHAIDSTLPPEMLVVFFTGIFIASAVLLAYPILSYMLFSFQIGENAITTHSGVIFRQHETINFSRIQSVENERGPILALLGLTLVEVWTASPNQYATSPAAIPTPDMRIYMRRDESHALKDFMLQGPRTAA